MNTFEKLCEMDASNLIGALLGGNIKQAEQPNMQQQPCSCQNATAIKSVQPTDGVDNAGMVASKKIQISESPEGDIRIDTDDVSIQLSSMVVNALKIYFERINKT